MARIKIEDVIEHLSVEMRRALQRAVQEAIPEVECDSHKLFRAFRRAVRARCNTWEEVPDTYVELR